MELLIEIPLPAVLAILAAVWLIFLTILVYTGLIFLPDSPWVDLLAMTALVTGLAAGIYLIGYVVYVAVSLFS